MLVTTGLVRIGKRAGAGVTELQCVGLAICCMEQTTDEWTVVRGDDMVAVRAVQLGWRRGYWKAVRGIRSGCSG